ncbi:MAG: hypothetical protein K2X93_00735 [Candidatus Obscuribacterales bacterium]|nr:hypothetical protein [Candidatus Obscuribacterales bacterium]
MVCKKCAGAGHQPDTSSTIRCTHASCRFPIPANNQVCGMHSKREGKCEACGKKIGQTRNKGKSEDDE